MSERRIGVLTPFKLDGSGADPTSASGDESYPTAEVVRVHQGPYNPPEEAALARS
jgi:hypothetical protein